MPLLLLDVNIGGKKVARLVVNEGDDLDRLVTTFATTYSLDSIRRSRLKAVIEKHLTPGLESIREDD